MPAGYAHDVLERALDLSQRLSTRVRARTGTAALRDASRLDGRVAVVCGGTGEVGEGIVAGLLIAGAKVAVPSRSGERLSALADRLEASGAPTERFVPVLADLSEMPDGAHEAAAELSRLCGRPDLVVVALGSWAQTDALADLEIDTWDHLMEGSLRLHQLAASAFLPLMRGRPGAMYVQINGAAARYPVAGAGAVSVAAAGELMAAQVMAAEEAGHGIQVESLVLGPVATRSRDDAAPWMVSARAVGDLIAYRAARRAAVADGVTTDGTGGSPASERTPHPGDDALAPGGPGTILELLTAADLGPARTAQPGALRPARGASLGWVLWGLQTASLSKQIRRGPPPRG